MVPPARAVCSDAMTGPPPVPRWQHRRSHCGSRQSQLTPENAPSQPGRLALQRMKLFLAIALAWLDLVWAVGAGVVAQGHDVGVVGAAGDFAARADDVIWA